METSWVLLGLACLFDINKVYLPTYKFCVDIPPDFPVPYLTLLKNICIFGNNRSLDSRFSLQLSLGFLRRPRRSLTILRERLHVQCAVMFVYILLRSYWIVIWYMWNADMTPLEGRNSKMQDHFSSSHSSRRLRYLVVFLKYHELII